jgi:signal transduction histidine kinase
LAAEAMMGQRAEPLLRANQLSYSLGTLPLIQQVSLEIDRGEIVGLAGQSGAGKSALALLLAGIYTPTAGELYFDGRRAAWPFRARTLGIEVIHQQPEMAEGLDITSNVFLGNELGWPKMTGRWLKVPNRRRMDEEAARILAQLGMSYTSLREKAANLSGEQRQLIAIARTMTHPARMIIIDEPNLLLSYPYQQRLLILIQEWRHQGTAVLFGSDNVDHLMAVTDRIVVLRHGRLIAEHRTDATDREMILAAMVGATDQQQLTPIIWALDSYYRAREQAEKLHQRQSLLERELETHDVLNHQLIDQLADQITALDRANTALQDAQRRLLTELEQERKRLAREIHDQVIQDLLGVGYRLEEIEAGSAVTPALESELMEVRSSVRELVGDLRHICGALRPPTIDSLGLGSALQSYAYEWSKRTSIQVTLRLDPNLGRLPESTELSIFRIVQEGLNNIRKHAAAGAVSISLEHTSPRRLMLSIADDGRGLPADFDLARLPAEGHYGALGITERVALLGGRCRFQNRPEGGALIQAEIPHPRIELAELDD